jgi:cytochrome c oxidase subunit 2
MAREVAVLWWAMLAFGTVVLVVVTALWIYAMNRAPRQYAPDQEKRIHRRWIIGGGIILPTVSVMTLLWFGIPAGNRMLPLPLEGEQPLRIEVIGHQWWWEVRYPESGVVTANELHMPAGRPVDVEVSSADVIHSFWVPRLGGKVDMFPGMTNVVRLQADEPGMHRGQCAEFCGTEHAHMVFHVTVHDDAGFAAWQEEMKP